MTITIPEAMSQLAGFTTADEVADFLSANGVTGRRGLTSDCPLARWLSGQTGQEVCVGPFSVFADDFMVQSQGERVEHTPAVGDFIDKFDRNEYPDLVEGANL